MMNDQLKVENDSNGRDRGRRRGMRQPAMDLDVANADRAIRAFVTERPFAAVALAMAAGYLMARSINALR